MFKIRVYDTSKHQFKLLSIVEVEDKVTNSNVMEP